MLLPKDLPNTYPPSDFLTFFSEKEGIPDEDLGNSILSLGHIVSYYALEEFIKGSRGAFTMMGDFSPGFKEKNAKSVIFPVSELSSRKEMSEILKYVEEFVMTAQITLHSNEVYPESPYARVQSFVNESGAKHKIFFFGVKSEEDKTNVMGGIAIDIESAVDNNDMWKSFLDGGGISYLFSIPNELLLASSVIFDNYLNMSNIVPDAPFEEIPRMENESENGTSDAVVLDEWTS